MFEHVLVGLDGSELAEKAIPLARRLCRGRLTFLRVLQDPAEIAREEEVLRDVGRRHGAQLRFVVDPDPAAAICAELARDPNASAVLATHGRSAWSEAILGSIALRVLRDAERPVILFRPSGREWTVNERIETVAAMLDGSGFSEKILPYAARAAQALSARLFLLQCLPTRQTAQGELAIGTDVVESSYLHRKASDIETRYGLRAEWEVLHGEPGPAICRFIEDMPGVLLAMTTHARGPAERAIMGSVTAHCIRHAGAPLMLYWPLERRS